MSAIAQYCTWQGIAVTGSDRDLGVPAVAGVEKNLRAIGCRLYPQNGSGVHSGVSGIVVSTAIEPSNPDYAHAQKQGVAVFHRSDVLAAIVDTRKTIAVAGTSGKSTVTALLFHLLECCGANPSLITGGNLHGLIQRGYIGNAFSGESDLLVIEADESDGSLVRYRPYLSIFLNISKDHKEIPEVVELFRALAAQSEYTLVNSGADALDTLRTTHRFGTSGAEEFAGQCETDDNRAAVVMQKTRFETPFPGLHTANNLLASLSACLFLGCTTDSLAAGARSFSGVERRFDRIMTRRNIAVIDDFAHNPDKIRAAVAAAHARASRLFALFQPHGYGPARFMRREFASAFRESLHGEDTLILLPIFYAGGTATRDISSQDMAADLADCPFRVTAPADRHEAIAFVAENVREGDTVLSMGARDPSLSAFARGVAAAIETRMA